MTSPGLIARRSTGTAIVGYTRPTAAMRIADGWSPPTTTLALKRPLVLSKERVRRSIWAGVSSDTATSPRSASSTMASGFMPSATRDGFSAAITSAVATVRPARSTVMRSKRLWGRQGN